MAMTKEKSPVTTFSETLIATQWCQIKEII